MYTKLATALGACALLFSTGAWGQCADGEISVDYTITPGSFPSEITWQLNDADGNNLFLDGGAVTPGWSGSTGAWCLAPGDYTFIGTDSYGDGWNFATASFFVGGALIANFDLTPDECDGPGCSEAITFTVSSDVPGCTDASAGNYNENATTDDGSCCFDNIVTINLFDQFGDGWTFGDTWGGIVIDGDSTEFIGGPSLSFDVCLPDTCLDAQISIPTYGAEGSWNITQDGVILNSGSGSGGDFSGSFFIYAGTGDCIVYGCLDPAACNFDAEAGVNLDNGSCDYTSCAGCTDPTACNYDQEATLDNGSCDFSCVGCLDPNALNYCGDCTIDDPESCVSCPGIQYQFTIFDVYGDGICCLYGEGSYSVTLDGQEVASGGDFGFSETSGFCAEDSSSCVIVTLLPDDYPTETTWELTNAITGELILSGDGTAGSFGTGTCTGGCNDAGACNYDAAADLDDGSCDYSCLGCTDDAAANYNPDATVDDGNCVYCNPGTFIFNVDMADSFGDGWNGAQYGIFNDGGTVYQGSLDSAFTGDLASGRDVVCLGPGCYTFQVTAGDYPEEISVSLSDEFGTDYGTIGAPATYGIDFTLTGQCSFEGCTDPQANNFNPSASIDDGSCQNPPANDLIENAEAIACGLSVAGTVQYSNDEGAAGLEFGQFVTGGTDVWYVINSDSEQQITVTTCGTPSNVGEETDYVQITGLNIYTQDLEGNLTPIANNNNGCESGSLSTVTWTASTGQDYFIRVEAYNGNEFVISASCNPDQSTSPSNDNCADAYVSVPGETYEGTLCGANAEAINLPWEGTGTAYGVYFTINSGDYDSFEYEANNLSNESIGWAMLLGDGCDNLGPFVGNVVTGTIAGSLSDAIIVEPNTDYYFVIWTDDQSLCGEFDYTINGIYLGCTDESANNYDMQATEDDGSCDYSGLTAENDTCGDAIALACDTVISGTTGGATAVDAPNGIAGCDPAPGTGVWYSFLGDGQIHTLSTCGSSIDSKINLLSADTVCGQFTCVEAANSSDGNGVCSLFDADDVNITFTSEVGVLYYVYVSAQDQDNDPTTDDNGTFELSFTCTPVVDGCTDPGACNYDADATQDDGSCELFSCLCPDSTGNALQFNMYDSYGDGWDIANYVITDLNSDTVASGNLNDALIAVDVDNITGNDSGYDLLCLQDGCYIITVDGGNWPSEVSWEVLASDGTLLASGGPTDGISLTLGAAVCGCTDSGACNYDETATSDDGSCDYDSCGGCTDTGACNFDFTAIIDDGSCCYDNCVTVNMNDSFGDGWNGAIYTLTNVDGTEIGSGTIDAGSSGSDTYCLANGCYVIEVTGGAYPGEVSWSVDGAFGGFVEGGADASQTFNGGSGDQCVAGCDIACACNYDPDATISDVSTCVFDGCSGCTYEGAPQYDPTATADDGSCTFTFANPCPADLNEDGSVSTADLLEFLTAFGQVCPE